MKQGWEINKLGEVCENVSNINWKTISLDTKLPYIDLSAVDIDNSNIDDFEYINKDNAPSRAKQIVNTGDVIFATTRPLLKRVCVITKSFNNAIASTGFCVLRPKGKVVSKWIYYILKSDSFYTYIEPLQKGISYPAVSDNEVKNFSIPVPPLAEQEHIVAELDLLSGIIEKQKQQLKEYDTLAQSIFYTMFGDPITNEKGWEVDCIGNIADFYNGAAHEGLISQKGYCVVNSKFISTNGLVRKYCEQQILPLLKNDIVMVMSDVPNGKALAKCYLIEADNKYTLNQRICAFRNYKLNPLYFFYYLNRHPYYLRFDDGNAQTNLRRNDVLKCPVSIPSLTLQQEFAEKIEAIEQQKALIKQSLAETETLFNSRMDYYFN